MVQSEFYTVTLRSTSFQLDRSQVEFDSPNYFTACFLGSFVESLAREIRLSRNPSLFALIVNYLSGYSIFPLPEVEGMRPEGVLENLSADALFYGLDDLVELLEKYKTETSNKARERVEKSWLMIYWPLGLGSRTAPFIVRVSETQAQLQCSTHPISPSAAVVLYSPGTAIINKLLRDQKINARDWSWSAFWTVFRVGTRDVECDCAMLEVTEIKKIK